MTKKKDELREILVRLMYCASENAFYSPKSLDQAQREIEALMPKQLSKAEIVMAVGEVLIRHRIPMTGLEGDLIKAILKAQEERDAKKE